LGILGTADYGLKGVQNLLSSAAGISGLDSPAFKVPEVLTTIGLGSSMGYVDHLGMGGIQSQATSLMAEMAGGLSHSVLGDWQGQFKALDIMRSVTQGLDDIRAAAQGLDDMRAMVMKTMWPGDMIAAADAHAAFKAHLDAMTAAIWVPKQLSPEDQARRAAVYERARQAFEAAGFGFAADHLPTAWRIWAGRLDPTTAPRIVRRSLQAWSQSDDFALEMEDLFGGSPTLSRRWTEVSQGLSAHRRGEYASAVRNAFSDLEGTYGDGLILERRASGRSGRIYRKEGRLIKRDPNSNKREEIKGLHALVQWSGQMRDTTMRVVADYLLNQVAPERNPILHGRWTGFGTARRSTQLWMFLWVMARWVQRLEQQHGVTMQRRRRLN
jgi:hypothetical protein